MRRLFAATFFILVGCALATVAFKCHWVQTKDGSLFITKTSPSLEDTYVDVRHWDAAEWSKHPRLAEAMTEAGHEKYIVRPKPASPVRNFLKGLKQSITGKDDESTP
ncbi:MAG: hypothetical protein Tsb009_19750 [Planctomycetaceae bacterium]